MRPLESRPYHIFDSNFIPSLMAHGPEQMAQRSAMKDMNIFEKGLLIIPFCHDTFHWSVIAIVNPGGALSENASEKVDLDGLPPTLVHFDSLRAHSMYTLQPILHKWMNYESERLNIVPGSAGLFDSTSLHVCSPNGKLLCLS